MAMFRTPLLFILAVVAGIASTNASSATAPAGASRAATTPAQDKSPLMSRDEVIRILANNRKIVSPHGIDEMVKVRVGGDRKSTRLNSVT